MTTLAAVLAGYFAIAAMVAIGGVYAAGRAIESLAGSRQE